jgi:hypothetical protein
MSQLSARITSVDVDRGDESAKSTRTSVLAPPDTQPILPRLSGAASMRHELEALLGAAPPDARPAVYRELVLDQNVTGKASASARLWVWKRVKLRYVLDPSVPAFRAFQACLQESPGTEQRGLLCFVMLARTDRLFRDVTLECVSPLLGQEGYVVAPAAIHEAIERRGAASGASWSATTLDRTAKHLMTSLKDFGVLVRSATKRIARLRPGPQVALFCARLARLEGLTDRQLLEARWFQLLGLEREQVADLLYSAARAGALLFRMQADVVELDLPPLEAA